MSLTMTKEEREAFLADVHVAIKRGGFQDDERRSALERDVLQVRVVVATARS
jgi:hypothetical protein